MKKNIEFTIINGVKCFNPEVANSYTDYPGNGFDLTNEIVEKSFWLRSRNRLFKKIIFDQITATRKLSLLEVGCGTGNFIEHIADNQNLEITGSEIYLKGLLYAKKNLPEINFIQFDVSQGITGDKFDLIVAFDVIEHIDNDVAALLNMNKMLQNKGKLILTVPQHMFLWSKLDEIVKHKRRYSRDELLSKLKGSGFNVTYSTSFVFVLFPLMLIARLFGRKYRDSLQDDSVFEKMVTFPRIINFCFDLVMRIDEALIRCGISLPFGGTLIVVAEKNN
jgi:2-polyprenyl-3-methyl-5-hydroxy-6-metoxy-1,4-benzoquinol methylase